MKVRVALLMFVVAALSAAAHLLGAFTPLDNALSAFRFKADPRLPTGSIAVVEIDARSLAAIGTWPWPRQIHAGIVDRLREAGAATIALDIDFSTQSTEESDAALEAALQRANGAVILAAFHQPASATDPNAVVYSQPIERFARNAWPGTVNVRPDPDGAIRRASFGEWIDGIPMLSIAALLSGASGTIGTDFGIDFSIVPSGIGRISAIDLIEGRVEPASITGRNIIVAASAVELRDIFEVPVHGFVSGGLLQALAAETLAQDRAIAEAGPGVTLAGLFVLAGLAAVAINRRRWTYLILGLGLAAVTIELAAFLIQSRGALIVETGAWLAALVGFAAVALAREVDLRGLAEAAFRRDSLNTRTVLKRVVEDSYAGVVVADRTGRIIAASDAVASILRLPSGDFVGRNQIDVLPGPLAGMLRESIDIYPADLGEREVAVTILGDELILEVKATASALASGRGKESGAELVGCVTFEDVTEKRRLEARTEQLAWFDTLTGLPNRNSFAERLRAAMADVRENGGRATLLFFDVDRFKNVNDTLGHHFGDLLLVAIAGRTRALLTETDFLVRLGGDEFAVISRGTSRDQVARLAARIVETMSTPFMLDGYRVAIGASVGIAVLGEGNADTSSVMKQADLALHAAKSDGSGHRFFDPSLDDNLDERRRIEVALWDTLRSGELEISYQPQVDLGTGRIIGCEALSRWTHPEMGQISPDRFVPIAEATGLIDPIGVAVLTSACKDIEPLGDLKVAVNVSPVQFVRGDLTRAVGDALSASGLHPARLELEITESLFLTKGSLVRDKMRELINLGVSFALDDFGTGYSSLNYVRQYPIGKIKIDRSFVTGLLTDRSSSAIVGAVVAMAEGMGKRVIAEGIETEEQRNTLRRLGCQEGQGYLFGKAMPADRLAELIAAAPRPKKLSA